MQLSPQEALESVVVGVGEVRLPCLCLVTGALLGSKARRGFN